MSGYEGKFALGDQVAARADTMIETAAPKSGLGYEVVRLDDEIERLGKHVSILSDKLQSVLVPVPEPDDSAVPGPSALRSTASDAVATQRLRLSALVDRVMRLHEGLDL